MYKYGAWKSLNLWAARTCNAFKFKMTFWLVHEYLMVTMCIWFLGTSSAFYASERFAIHDIGCMRFVSKILRFIISIVWPGICGQCCNHKLATRSVFKTLLLINRRQTSHRLLRNCKTQTQIQPSTKNCIHKLFLGFRWWNFIIIGEELILLLNFNCSHWINETCHK